MSGWQFKRLRFYAGHAIVREGDLGSEAFIVTSGRCIVYQGEGDTRVELKQLGVGDVFGELAVFAGQNRTATVEAVSDVSVMVLEKHHLEEDLGMGFWLGVVVKALADRFLEVSRELAELKKKPPSR